MLGFRVWGQWGLEGALYAMPRIHLPPGTIEVGARVQGLEKQGNEGRILRDAPHSLAAQRCLGWVLGFRV